MAGVFINMSNKRWDLVRIFESVNGVKISEAVQEGNQRGEYIVYHGTNEKFSRFSLNKSAQGIIWFTDSIESIQRGDHGGQGSKYIVKRKITITNPAGWPEYEKYTLGQLRGLGYDGVILSQGDYSDYIVFDTDQIRVV